MRSQATRARRTIGKALRITGRAGRPSLLAAVRAIALLAIPLLAVPFGPASASWTILDTGQEQCFDNAQPIPCPDPEQAFHGQDAQHDGTAPAFQDNGDGTVTDLRTGLMWQKSFAWDVAWEQAVAEAASFDLAGYTDWRLPTIKELYSLIQFSGFCAPDSSISIPFIDRDVFDFAYGHPRFIDHQEWSSTSYVGSVFGGDPAAFGVNFADGRIKGYPKTMAGEVRYVRGGDGYGINVHEDNSDGTITDTTTGLVWAKEDSGVALDWESALAWARERNAEGYLGHDDWRIPNAKELQSIVDYTRAPDVTGTPACDPLFDCTPIVNEGGAADYPYFWASTTHEDGPPEMRGAKSVYVAFGRALGWMEVPPQSGHWVLMDVHGAGAQRSDFKAGDPSDFPHGHGPQGDVVRIENFVRLVRGNSVATGVDTGESGDGSRQEGWMWRALPNPTSSGAVIELDLPEAGDVRIDLFQADGRRIRTLLSARLPASRSTVAWDGLGAAGRPLPAGVYIVKITTAQGTGTLKIARTR